MTLEEKMEDLADSLDESFFDAEYQFPSVNKAHGAVLNVMRNDPRDAHELNYVLDKLLDILFGKEGVQASRLESHYVERLQYHFKVLSLRYLADKMNNKFMN